MRKKRDKYKNYYAILSNEITSAVNHQFETQFSGGKVTTNDSKESIASLLTLDELISPLRVHTFNTLPQRFINVLELSGINSLDQYPEDKINFSKQYWIDMLKIYGPEDRKFLGKDTTLFLLLKLTLQSLAQIRLLRVTSTSAFLAYKRG